MPLTLMYITNNPVVAGIAQRAGVDRIWIDMEYIGKEERQAGMNTVKSRHTFEDIQKIKPLLTSSQLLVRVNPLHHATTTCCSSKEEIERSIACGADIVMLPMFKTRREVETFIDYVNGRATVLLLVETAEANENIEDIISVPGIDEIHIGLNDLHLAYHKKFMFELLADGTVDRLCRIIKEKGIRYGFGGVARVGYGMLPAELIITEHYSLGSQMAILSRGFCDANVVEDPSQIEDLFIAGVKGIRDKEDEVRAYSKEQYLENHSKVVKIVQEIVDKLSCGKEKT